MESEQAPGVTISAQTAGELIEDQAARLWYFKARLTRVEAERDEARARYDKEADATCEALNEGHALASRLAALRAENADLAARCDDLLEKLAGANDAAQQALDRAERLAKERRECPRCASEAKARERITASGLRKGDPVLYGNVGEGLLAGFEVNRANGRIYAVIVPSDGKEPLHRPPLYEVRRSPQPDAGKPGEPGLPHLKDLPPWPGPWKVGDRVESRTPPLRGKLVRMPPTMSPGWWEMETEDGARRCVRESTLFRPLTEDAHAPHRA